MGRSGPARGRVGEERHGTVRRHRPRRHQDPGGGGGRAARGARRLARADADGGRPGRRHAGHGRRRARRGRAGRRRRPGGLDAVGVGSPGAVDDEAGTVTSARNLPDWEGSYPLAEKLEAALAAPIALSNDVNVATMAEFELGAAKPFRSLLGVFWGTGVGGGIVFDGALWEGRGAAGEIGHMVVKSDGRRCPCGRIGCMEAYAGRGAMETRAREKVRRRREDRAVQDHGGARPDAARRAASGRARSIATTSSRSICSTRRWRRSASPSPPRSTCSTSRP